MVHPPDEQVLEFLNPHDSPVGELALAVRTVVLEVAPGAVEKVYRNHPSAAWYGSGPKMGDMFCYIATARTHVNLGFCRGATLADPKQVLEGTGKVMRHIKIRSPADLKRPYLRSFLRAALRHAAPAPVEPVLDKRTLALKACLEALPAAVGEPYSARSGAVPIVILYKVMNKIFAILALKRIQNVILKCDPHRAVMLRERYEGVGHRSHLDRRYWISVDLDADVPAKQVRHWAKQSYDLVCATLTRRQQAELVALCRASDKAPGS